MNGGPHSHHIVGVIHTFRPNMDQRRNYRSIETVAAHLCYVNLSPTATLRLMLSRGAGGNG
jgi:hypothetical protein